MDSRAILWAVRVTTECRHDNAPHCGCRCVASYEQQDGSDSSREGPLQGDGATPLEALAQLVIKLMRWRLGDAEAWMSSPEGERFLDEVRMLEIRALAHGSIALPRGQA